MKRKLTFKHRDLIALLLCVIAPVFLTIITTGFFQLAMFFYSYFIGCGYIILSCILNRFLLPKAHLSRIRIICEVAFGLYLIAITATWCINQFGNTTLQHMDTSYLYTALFVMPFFALLYIVISIQEVIKLRKATKSTLGLETKIT